MKVEPYLFFEGNCEEAMQFYKRALGATEIKLMRYKESPEPSPPGMVPPGWENKIMHSYLRIGRRLVRATPHDRAWDAIGDTPLVRATRRALADTGVTVLDVEILRLAPGTEVRDFEGLLDTAASLGAAYLLVAGNDPDEARLTERYAALCDLAAERGLVVCIEP